MTHDEKLNVVKNVSAFAFGYGTGKLGLLAYTKLTSDKDLSMLEKSTARFSQVVIGMYVADKVQPFLDKTIDDIDDSISKLLRKLKKLNK